MYVIRARHIKLKGACQREKLNYEQQLKLIFSIWTINHSFKTPGWLTVNEYAKLSCC